MTQQEWKVIIMHKYRVLIFKGLALQQMALTTFVAPWKTVELEMSVDATDNEIHQKALEKVGSYPKSHHIRIIRL